MSSQKISDILVIDDDSILLKLNRHRIRSPRDRLRTVQIDFQLQTAERNTPIHGTRIEVLEAQPAGQRPRNRALACAGGPINGDHTHPVQIGFGHVGFGHVGFGHGMVHQLVPSGMPSL